MKFRTRVVPTLAAIVAAFSALSAHAIDTDPYDFGAPAPGVAVTALYYGDISSNSQYSKGSKATSNNINAKWLSSAFVKFHDVGGYVVGTKLVIPTTSTTIAPNPTSATISGSGIGDPILVAPVWLSSQGAKTSIAVIPYLQLPLGNYDKNAAVNPGQNRWKFAIQPGISTPLTDAVTLDVVGDAQFFGKNSDTNLEQKPLFSVQSHVSYKLASDLSVSLGGYKYLGGETKTNGVSGNDKINTTTLIGSLGYWVNPSTNLQFQYRTDTSVANGAKFSGVQFRFLHAY